ncbi:hypothetical protein [Listeria fleischmannii]|uniref:Uncharacterized protein n=1 Tax=Listeria fleischmannii FSL S10-1203 TaxID=1265822 RepID=W7D6M5_9LIST|nr:hypothetical protein [Listeria fleischmannii]EUJ44685.1 hypothetical protein MCOL2_19696 [Listeria fleischmannii FSL S10-1203]
MEYGYRVKFHTPNKSVTVLLILPYCLEASTCVGILEDWLAFKAKKRTTITMPIKNGTWQEKNLSPDTKRRPSDRSCNDCLTRRSRAREKKLRHHLYV